MRLRLLAVLCILIGFASCKKERNAADVLLLASYEESSRVYNDRSDYIDIYLYERSVTPIEVEKSETVKKIRLAVDKTLMDVQGADRKHSLESIVAGRKTIDSLSEFDTNFTELSLLEELDGQMFLEAVRNDFLRNEMNVLEMYRSKYFLGSRPTRLQNGLIVNETCLPVHN